MALPVPGDHAGGFDGGQIVPAAALHRGGFPGCRQSDGGGGFLRSVRGVGAGAAGQTAVLGHGWAGALQVGPALLVGRQGEVDSCGLGSRGHPARAVSPLLKALTSGGL